MDEIKPWKSRMKLYIKLMLSFGILFFAVLCSIVGVTTYFSSHILHQAIGNDLTHIAETSASKINEYLSSKLTELQITAAAPVIFKGNTKEISTYFNDIINISKDYDCISVVNPNGKIIASSKESFLDKNLNDIKPDLVSFFDKAKQLNKGEVLLHESLNNQKENQLNVHYLVPIYNEKNTLIAVLIAQLTRDKIIQYILELEDITPGSTPAFLLNENGTLLVTGNENDKKWKTSFDQIANSQIKEIISGNTNGYIFAKDHNNDTNLLGYAHLKNIPGKQKSNWVIVTIAPEETTLAPAFYLRNILLFTAFIAFLFLIILSYFFAKIITTPLKQMVKRMNEISQDAGDLTQTITIRSNDEVGELASAFNQMIGSIRKIIILITQTAEGVSTSSLELSTSAEQLSSTSQQIAASVQQIARSSQNQAQQLQGANQEIEKMSHHVAEVKKASKDSADNAILANQMAEKGGEYMQATTNKMNSIYDTVMNSSQVIQSLGTRSVQIGEIVGVITEIADQTNLLALNAAIEAARAGDAGRGFAVVADEVKKLAEGSAKAAEQIRELIKGIQEETNQAVKAMEEGFIQVKDGRETTIATTKALEDIITCVAKTSQYIQDIKISADHMSEGTEKVVRNIDEIASNAEESASGAEQAGTSTEQLSASMQEVAASSEELAQMALDLRETVQQFKIHTTIQTEPSEKSRRYQNNPENEELIAKEKNNDLKRHYMHQSTFSKRDLQ